MEHSKTGLSLAVALLSFGWLIATPSFGAEPKSANAAASLEDLQPPDRTQRDSVQGAIDQLRREMDPPTPPAEPRPETSPTPVAAQEEFSTRLNLIEQTLVYQQQRGFEAVQSSNRTILIVAAGFAGLGLLGLLFAALILVRSLNRFSEMVMSLPVTQNPMRGQLHGMNPTDLHPALPEAVEQVSSRFLGAIDLLEKRIQDLEHVGQQVPRAIAAPVPAAPPPAPERRPSPAPTMVVDVPGPAKPSNGGHPPARDFEAEDPGQQVSLLVGKGQALLSLGQVDEALACFDQALVLEPRHADTLVKRGMALERLQRLEDAVQSYDRAIAADGSLTVAFLHKGAACNRLQRFREALECYEKALRSEQKTTVTL